MKKEDIAEYRAIENIRNKHGDLLFRAGLTHLVDTGARNLLNDEAVQATIKQIREETPDNSVMTAEFMEEIVNCAAELATIEIWDVLRYVKTDLEISGWGGYEFDDEEELDEDDGYYI